MYDENNLSVTIDIIADKVYKQYKNRNCDIFEEITKQIKQYFGYDMTDKLSPLWLPIYKIILDLVDQKFKTNISQCNK
jgi:hypothetical protein